MASRLFWMASLSLVVSGLIGGSWFIYRQVLRSGALDVRDVAVFGTARVGDELADYLQLRTRTPLVDVDAERLAERLKKHPWIKDVQVVKSYPHKLELRIEEREPALLHLADKLYVVDDEGRWIKPLDAYDAFDLPVVTNLAANPVTQATAKMQRIVALSQYWDAVSSPVRIGEIRVLGDDEVLIYTLNDGPALHLPLRSEVWPELRRRLERVLLEANRMGVRLRSVDLLYPDRAVALKKT